MVVDVPAAAASEPGDLAEVGLPHDRTLGIPPPPGPFQGVAPLDTEIVVGLVGALGTDWENVCRLMSDRLKALNYNPVVVRMSELIPELARADLTALSKDHRAAALINLGNRLRDVTKNNSVLAQAAVARIARERKAGGRNAYIIRSVKHPDEIGFLRLVYSRGFHLFGVHTPRKRRLAYLTETRRLSQATAEILITRDEHETERYGQHTRDSFHLADFFLADEGSQDKLRENLHRCLNLMFGDPRITPTFGEFAMFLAFSSSLRSADLARQVGAVVAMRQDILATGGNDCPRAGGGLYWPHYDEDECKIVDAEHGRDYRRGYDNNHRERERIIKQVAIAAGKSDDKAFISQLREGGVGDITEYSRSVHAEMDALLSCARRGVSCLGAWMYVTTFPCHNCAKHIVAAGIDEVIYVEPYPKSKALEFHEDSITSEKPPKGDKLPPRGSAERKVRFRPFIGVGPRRFYEFFSTSLGFSRDVQRKAADGLALGWSEDAALPRVPMMPVSYLDLEGSAVAYLEDLRPKT